MYTPNVRAIGVSAGAGAGYGPGRCANEYGREAMVRPTRLYLEPGERKEGGGGRLRYHVLAVQAMIGGKDRLAGYVARLEVGECARILAASPLPLSALAAEDAESRVGADEGRGFDEVIRVWTLRVLAHAEGS